MQIVNEDVQSDLKKLISSQLGLVMAARGHRNIKELFDEVEKYGLKYDSFNNYASGKVEPKAGFFAAMYEFGINLDWLIAGEGEMYRANRPDQVNKISYSGNGVAVHNNHGMIGVGEATADTGGRGLRLCDFVRWWMETHSTDDQAWLESQIKRSIPEYEAWLKGQGK